MKKDLHKENWNRVAREGERIDSKTDQRLREGIEKKIKPVRKYSTLYAAAAVVVFLAFGAYFLRLDNPTQPLEKAPIAYMSDKASRRVELADGSVILMEPHSKLFVGKEFGKESRPIRYEGKGTFSIAKDKQRPFVIDAQGFSVKVLGTKFFLDQTDGKQTVELKEGKVQITHQNEITYLLPNEKWVQNPVLEKKQQSGYESSQSTFFFENESFATIVSKLETEYNLKIEYPEKYAHQQIEGSVTGSMEEILSTLCYPLSLKVVKISEKKIKLTE